jgi:hypothetical protein
VRVDNVDGADLRTDKDNGGNDEAPDTTSVQVFDEKIGADTWSNGSKPKKKRTLDERCVD